MAQALKVSGNVANIARLTMSERKGNLRNDQLNQADQRRNMPKVSPAKNVLITHVPEEEGILWQAVLASQGISAHFEANWRIFNPNLLESLKELAKSGRNLPDMLILDMGVKLPGSDELHSGVVCHWCSKYFPRLKIMLINARAENISDLSKRWGLRRGAIDVLPKLSRDNLLILTVRVTSVLDCQLSASALKNIVELMPDSLDRQSQRAFQDPENAGFDPQIGLNPNQDSEEITRDLADQNQTTQPLGETLNNSTTNSLSHSLGNNEQSNNLPNTVRSDDDFIIYRGVKVRKKKR